ncbi:helix-turn-helix domain-containing protein [Streptomyces paludis]|uniref:XRE family transcriptional regulator n=1 Tax=Streptomyces paludis TaxID=2282738 RepID=A0A345HQS7_9ACTN|nr:helix-turn-helix transcriptional regulator [Streptomyces paludis]AXG79051.1 XRE family transcriptional regulator [Streptomyces paludis]
MAARRGPTYRRRELGKELRKLREKRGLTIQEAAAHLGFSHTKLARVEIGENDLPRVSDLEGLMDLYGLDAKDDRETLLQLHRESLSKEPWTPYKHFMPSKMPTYRGLELDSNVMRSFQPHVVFGLLQTENYSRALYLSAKPVDETTTEYVETNVQLRMERKELITRTDNPLELRVIMDEAAVRCMVGGPDVMREQYDEIIDLARLENVTVQILPHRVLSYRAESNFAILGFPDDLAPIVQVDMPNTISVSDDTRDVQAYTRRFDAMRESASAPAETASLLNQLAREWT